jgi:hypothetical protein
MLDLQNRTELFLYAYLQHVSGQRRYDTWSTFQWGGQITKRQVKKILQTVRPALEAGLHVRVLV